MGVRHLETMIEEGKTTNEVNKELMPNAFRMKNKPCGRERQRLRKTLSTLDGMLGNEERQDTSQPRVREMADESPSYQNASEARPRHETSNGVESEYTCNSTLHEMAKEFFGGRYFDQAIFYDNILNPSTSQDQIWDLIDLCKNDTTSMIEDKADCKKHDSSASTASTLWDSWNASLASTYFIGEDDCGEQVDE